MSDLAPSDPSQANKLTEFELDLLRQEYFFLQTTIEDYNKQIWVIKALGITGTGAVIALALQQGQSLIILVGCALPLFFWILESQWKHFQRGFYPRISEIERFFLDNCNFRGPAIFSGWCRSFKRNIIAKQSGYIWDGLLNPSVFWGYVLELIFLLTVWKFIPLP